MLNKVIRSVLISATVIAVFYVIGSVAPTIQPKPVSVPSGQSVAMPSGKALGANVGGSQRETMVTVQTANGADVTMPQTWAQTYVEHAANGICVVAIVSLDDPIDTYGCR